MGPILKASVLVRPAASTKFSSGAMRAVLLPARAALARDAERAFARAADPVTGRRWAPRKYQYPHPPLLKSGTMREAAILAATNARLAGSTLTATVAAPAYARFQQGGTRTITPRRFLGASIGTLGIVRANLIRAGLAEGRRVLRGR